MQYCKNLIDYPSDYDLIVCGGGTSGAVAAIMAAKLKLKTLIIEKYGALGGSQTLALVQPIMYSYVDKDYQYSSINAEIIEEMSKYGAIVGESAGIHCTQWFDSAILQKVLEDLLIKYGGEVLYETTLIDVVKNNNKIDKVVAYNNDGLIAYKAKYFIDATANGDISVFAGAKYTSGNKDGKNQAVSLRFEMSNVDINVFKDFLDSQDVERRWSPAYADMRQGVEKDVFCIQRFESKALDTAILKAYESGDLTKQDLAHIQMFGIPGKKNTLSFNCPEVGSDVNVLRNSFISAKMSEGRTAAVRIANFMKKYIPGFKDAFINLIAPMLGLRETREIETEYVLKIDDAVNYVKFDDGFVKTNYPIDIHGASEGRKLEYNRNLPKEQQYFEVPLRSLIVKGVDNLMVSGRCIGTDFYVQSCVRVQHSCRASGEAAAIAVKQCVDNEIVCRDVDGKAVREAMRNFGVNI